MLPEQLFKEPVSGPAYRPIARWFTLSMVSAILIHGTQVLMKTPALGWPVLVLFGAGMLVMLVSAWYMLMGKTTVDARGIRQDWFVAKDYPWSEIVRAQHVRMPFTSRLVIVTARGGPLRAIHGGCHELDVAFERISRNYGAPSGQA